MARFTKISPDTFKNLAINAGVVLKNFNPAEPGANLEDDIVGVTSGGVNFTATPTFTDYGEDIDNCPKNTKELKRNDGWEVKMSGTFITMTLELAKQLSAAADSDASSHTITPRTDLATTDFTDLWFVMDYSDKNGETNGGCIAVKIINALSTGGFALQSTDKGKGKFAFEFTGHVSIEQQSVVPFEIYVIDGAAEPES